MINARDCPTAASAGYPNSFSAPGFHDVIMPLLSTITIASSGAAAVHRDNPDALPDAKPPCGALLSTCSILCRGQPRDPGPHGGGHVKRSHGPVEGLVGHDRPTLQLVRGI